jgi:hypothetical protein
MSKAQTDIRRTSYNAATANPNGYVGTIDDAIAQIRAEPDETLHFGRERAELLDFLGVHKPKSELSGIQKFVPMPASYVDPSDWTFDDGALDHVEYGVPEQPREPGFYTLAYAQQQWPQNFVPRS